MNSSHRIEDECEGTKEAGMNTIENQGNKEVYASHVVS